MDHLLQVLSVKGRATPDALGVAVDADASDALAQLVADGLVGRDRVMAGVDCGFSVHVGTQSIDPDVTWAKLRSLAEGAALASKRT